MSEPLDAALLVERHGPWLVAWFRVRAVPAHEAEELAQEVLLRLVRNLDGIRSPEAVRTWLRRAASDQLARHRRRRPRVELTEEPAQPEDPPGGNEELMEALRSLPPELEEVLLVRFGRDLGYEETADVLGVSRATVQSRLRRALARLREVLGGSGELRA